MDRRAAGALLALAACIACSAAAPTTNDQTALDTYDGAEGCYYNFQHYGEGDRIMTNEPCLNCTCHNRMLMCYLRVCPFTKAIGQDCTVEKRADQCCPIVTCPDVPVDLLTSTSTNSPAEYGSTGLGKQDKYGCSIDGKYFPEGAKVPPMPNKPCEHCYCIRNMTTCVMQECTLHVDGCTPIYHKDVCCPVRYSCDHPEDEIPLLDDMTTTVRPTPGFLLTTTTIAPVTQQSQFCVHDDEIIPDGALIKTDKACQHCYCMKGDMVCVVQDCGVPMENEGKNCTSLPPREGECCPDTYICEGDEHLTELPLDLETGAPQEEFTTLVPPRRVVVEGSGYRNEPDELPYTELPTFATEIEGSGEEQPTPSYIDSSSISVPEKEVSPLDDELIMTTEIEDDQALSATSPRAVDDNDITTSFPPLDNDLRATLPPAKENDKTTKTYLLDDELRTTLSPERVDVIATTESGLEYEMKTTVSPLLENDRGTSSVEDKIETTVTPTSENDKNISILIDDFKTTLSPVSESEIRPTVQQASENESATTTSFEDDFKTTTEPHLEENIQTMASPILEDNQRTTTEADKGENTIPDETPDEHPSDFSTPFKTTISDESKTTVPSIYKEPVTTQKSEVTSAFVEENIATNIKEQESDTDKSTTIATQESFTTKSPITEISLTTNEESKLTTPSSVVTDKYEPTEFGEPTIESVSTTSSLLDDKESPEYPSVETTTIAADKYDEPESTTYIAPEDIGRIPGEGDCLVDGITYKNYTIVPSTNKCQTGCRCVSSIIKCDPIICSLPPQDMENMNDCQPIYDSPDSCCPTYVCDNMNETIPPQPHSQMSATESTLTSKPDHECIGDDCQVKEGTQDNPSSPCTSDECHEKPVPIDQNPLPKPDDCTSGSCLNVNIVPVQSTDQTCNGDKCKSAAEQCSGDNCDKEPQITPSKDEPSKCLNKEDCKEGPIDAKTPCKGESCQQESTHVKPTCEGEDCKQVPIDVKPTCEEENCQQEVIDVKPDCEGEDCKQDSIDVKLTCEGEDCKQEPIDVEPNCEGEDCKQKPIDVKPTCAGKDCMQEPIDVKPTCKGEDCKYEPIDVKPSCEGENCKQETVDVKPTCEGEECGQKPIDVMPICEEDDCKQGPIDHKPCEEKECKDGSTDVKPSCDGSNCNPPSDIKHLCEGDSCTDTKTDCDHNNCDSPYLPADQTPENVACDDGSECSKPEKVGVICDGQNCRRKETSDVDTPLTPGSGSTYSDSSATDKPVLQQTMSPNFVTEKEILIQSEPDTTEKIYTETENPISLTTNIEVKQTPSIETSTSQFETSESENTAVPESSSEMPQSHDTATQSEITKPTNDLTTEKQQEKSSTPRFTETEDAHITHSESSTPSILDTQTVKETSEITTTYLDLITEDDNSEVSTQATETESQDKLSPTEPEKINTQSSVNSEIEKPESDEMHKVSTPAPETSDDQKQQTKQPEQNESDPLDTRRPQDDNGGVSFTEATVLDESTERFEKTTTIAASTTSDTAKTNISESPEEPQTEVAVESQDIATPGPKLEDMPEIIEEISEPPVEKEVVQTTLSVVQEALKPSTDSSVFETKLPEDIDMKPLETSPEIPKEPVEEITTEIPAAQTESPKVTYSEELEQPTTEKIELQPTKTPDSDKAVTEIEQIPESPVSEMEASNTEQPITDIKTPGQPQTQKEEAYTELPVTTEKGNNMSTESLYTNALDTVTEIVAPLDNRDLEKETETPEFVTESHIGTEAPSASEKPLTPDQGDVNKIPVNAYNEPTYQQQSSKEPTSPVVKYESSTVLPELVTEINKLDDDQQSATTLFPEHAQNTDYSNTQSSVTATETPLLEKDKPAADDLNNISEQTTLLPVTETTKKPILIDTTGKLTGPSVTNAIESSTIASEASFTEKQEMTEETVKPEVEESSYPEMTDNKQLVTKPTMVTKQPESVSEAVAVATELPGVLSSQKESMTQLPDTQELTTQSDNIQRQTLTEEPLKLVTEAEGKPTVESEQSMSLVTKNPGPADEIVTEMPYEKVTEPQDTKYTIVPSDTEPDRSVTKEPESTEKPEKSVTEIPHDLVYEETPTPVEINKPIFEELTTNLPKEQEQTTESKQVFSETTPYFVELDVHTHKTIEESSTNQPINDEITTEHGTDNKLGQPEISTEQTTDEEKQTVKPIKEELKPVDDKQQVTETSLPAEASTSPDNYQTSSSVPELISKPEYVSEHATTESPDSEELDTRYAEEDKDKQPVAPTQSAEEPETTTPIIYKETEKPSLSGDNMMFQTDKNIFDSSPYPETASPEEFIAETTKATTSKAEEEASSSPSPTDNKFTKPDDKETETIPSATPEEPEPGPNDIQPTDEIPSPDDEFPSSGTSGYGQETDYDDQVFGPGTCRYGGKVYVSAQQIPRDDPCDFCFCFRSDIICLQQSCPPPIHGCREEPIQGFCCPRYECPVSMATTLNVTTTTTTTTTTLPPHFLPHAYKGAAQRRGCQIKGHTYKVGEVVRASSGPCLHCTCGGDGQMKCDPKACTPEPMLRQMIAAAVSSKRRR